MPRMWYDYRCFACGVCAIIPGILRFWGLEARFSSKKSLRYSHFSSNSLRKLTGKIFRGTGKFWPVTGNFTCNHRKRPFLAHLFRPAADAICSHRQFYRWEDEMSSVRERYGEAFWRAHHEAWQQSALNQREYCESQGIPLKAFGNWRARFKGEAQPPVRKPLSRRR